MLECPGVTRKVVGAFSRAGRITLNQIDLISKADQVEQTREVAESGVEIQLRGRERIWLYVGAAVLGLLTAVAVWLFNQAIGVVRAVTINLQSAGDWMIPVTLAGGGILVALIMHFFHRPTRVPGVAHIIDGVIEHDGQLEKRTGLAFVIAAAISIGMGVPVGADGPTSMIGGHLASWLGTRFRQPGLFVRSLVVAGVGAGIATTYFAQLAAVFFALEVVLGGFGGAVFVVPTMIAVATASLTIQFLGGAPPQYSVALGDLRPNATLLLYAGVAVVAALAAIAYVNMLPRSKAFWDRMPLPFWAKTACMGLIIGVIAIWLPAVTGTGLVQMQAIFAGVRFPLGLLAVLGLATIVLTPQSLGAGFVGGTIGPALLIGSSLGAVYGEIVTVAFPSLGLSPTAFAMVCTAAMLAGTFHAPLFGAMMIYEMVNDYRILLPLLLAAAIGYALARPFQPGSAYTFMLHDGTTRLRRGTFSYDRRPAAKRTGAK